MEDAHTHLLSLTDDKDAAFFAVYDGHGGAKVAQYAGGHVHQKITSQPSYKKGEIVEAIKQGFLEIDADMLRDENMKDELAGTTAVVVLLKGNRIFCGNVGDSRAIASIVGRVQQLSYDHKPSNEAETKRILAAGGWVEFNRVNGNLALSRALGDFVFKKNDKKPPEEQIVTAYPDVVTKDITPEHEFIVLACDGIWDVMTNEEVVEFVRTRIAAQMDPEQICEELITRCLAPDCQMGGLGCDNMTVVLVCLTMGKPYQELADKCSQPPASLIMEVEDSESSDIDSDDQEVDHRQDRHWDLLPAPPVYKPVDLASPAAVTQSLDYQNGPSDSKPSSLGDNAIPDGREMAVA